MRTVDISYTKSQLSKLLECVASGEEVVIFKGGLPVAKLVPFTAAVRHPGSLRGRLRVGVEFDDPLPDELLRAFAGENETYLSPPSGVTRSSLFSAPTDRRVPTRRRLAEDVSPASEKGRPRGAAPTEKNSAELGEK